MPNTFASTLLPQNLRPPIALGPGGGGYLSRTSTGPTWFQAASGTPIAAGHGTLQNPQGQLSYGVAGGAGGGLSNQFGTGSFDPDTNQWNTGGEGSVSTGQGLSTASGGSALSGAGGGASSSNALQDLINAYGDRNPNTGNAENTGSWSGDWQSLLAAFPQLAPFIDPTQDVDAANLSSNRGRYFMPLQGPFSNNPFHLSGPSDALNFLLNISMADAAQQGQRSGEAENIMRQLAGNAQWSSQNAGNEMLAGAASDLVAPGSLNRLESAMREQAAQDVARSRMASEQAMRDAGMMGAGAGGMDALAALGRRSADSLADANRGITGDIESLRGQRVGQAADALGTSTDIYRALNQDPQRTLAGILLSPNNAQQEAFKSLLGQIGAIQQGVDQQIQSAPSTFESIVAPLIGSTIGAVGQSAGIGNFLKGLI